MKKLFSLYTLLALLSFVGCDKKGDDNIDNIICVELSEEAVDIDPEGGSVDVTLYCDHKWTLDGLSDWCTPSTTSGTANKEGQTISFSANVAYENRTALFEFRCAHETIELVVTQEATTIAQNTIIYTSTDGNIVEPYNPKDFGATIVSNTYEGGIGIIEFDAPVTKIGKQAFYECAKLITSFKLLSSDVFLKCSRSG